MFGERLGTIICELQQAIKENNIEVVKRLLLEDPDFLNPLSYPICTRKIRDKVVLLLLEAKNHRNTEIVKLFIHYLERRKHDVNCDDLEKYIPVLIGNVSLVENHLKNRNEKIKVPEWNLRLLVNCIFRKKVDVSRIEMLQLLIKHGFDAGYKDDQGENLLASLIQSAEKDDKDAIETAKLLLGLGVSINDVNDDGWTPLHFAVEKNDDQFVYFLIQNKADLNKQSEKIETPLHRAVSHDYLSVILILLVGGADVNIKTRKDGITMLHEACVLQNEAMIFFLIQNGINLQEEDNYGRTALSLLEDFEGEDDLEFDDDEDFPIEEQREFNREKKQQRAKCIIAMVKEYAGLMFEDPDHIIPSGDNDFIQRIAQKYFDQATDQLAEMRSTKLYSSLTFYSILKMSKNIQIKLAHLTKNEELALKFEIFSKKCPYYLRELNTIWEEAILMEKKFDDLVSQLKSVFSDLFPVPVVRKLAEYLTLEESPFPQRFISLSYYNIEEI